METPKIKSNNTVSVFDPSRGDYIYFKSDKTLKPTRQGRPASGIPIEEALPKVPSGCTCVGRGLKPMGTIATLSDYNYADKIWWLVGLGFIAYLIWSRNE